MKKINFLLPIFFVIFLFTGTSCNQQYTKTVENSTYTSASGIISGGFYVQQQIVVHGTTLWGISKSMYGTGLRWREIVKQNPFLKESNRIKYVNGQWIVVLKIGERLRIGSGFINPTYTLGEKITNNRSMISETILFPWWGWLVIFGSIGLITLLGLWLFLPNQRRNRACPPSAAIIVNENGLNIDQATSLTLFNHDHNLMMQREETKNNMINVIGKASDKELLSHFHFNLGPDNFSASVDYKGKDTETAPKSAPRPVKKVEKK